MAHPDLDALLNVALEMAQGQQAKRKGFLPFAVSMAPDGERSIGMAQVDDDANAPAMLHALQQGLGDRADAGELRAVALCWDATVRQADGKSTDAIAVGLEHAEGEAVDTYLPYRRRRLRGYAYGELFAMRRDRVVFRPLEPGEV